MRRLFIIPLLLLLSVVTEAQQFHGSLLADPPLDPASREYAARMMAAMFQISGSAARRVRRLASDPGTCTVGDVILNTTVPAFKVCLVTNTWTALPSSAAPTNATYITQTACATCSAEQALSSLSTGIMRVATTTGVITSLTDSAGIAANISDETGTGVLVLATSPVLTTPTLGVATATSLGLGQAASGTYAADFLAISGQATAMRIRGNNASTNNTSIMFRGANAAADQWLIGNAVITNDATRNFDFYDLVSGAGRLRITDRGVLKLGTGTAIRATTEGAATLDIFNGIAPVGTLADGISLYALAGELRVMDAAGNSTLLSPHDKKTNEWIYLSCHTVTGKCLKIDMERAMRVLEKLSGERIITEWQDTPQGAANSQAQKPSVLPVKP